MMTQQVTVEVDYDADAAYIRLGGERPVVRTHCVGSTINIDCDEFGVVIGIEVLGLATEIPWGKLERDFHVHSSVSSLVRVVSPTVAGFVTSVRHIDAGRRSEGHANFSRTQLETA